MDAAISGRDGKLNKLRREVNDNHTAVIASQTALQQKMEGEMQSMKSTMEGIRTAMEKLMGTTSSDREGRKRSQNRGKELGLHESLMENRLELHSPMYHCQLF